NLAQAVMVLSYEIMQTQYQAPPHQEPPLASLDEIEAMYSHMREAFTIHGFSGAHAIERGLMGLRRGFERAGLERRDVRLLRGIARPLAWALRPPRPPREAGTLGVNCRTYIKRDGGCLTPIPYSETCTFQSTSSATCRCQAVWSVPSRATSAFIPDGCRLRW